MREIKFRIWDGSNMYELGHLADIAYTETFEESWGRDFTVYTVMQYTGLKDKNGVEIYEGDLVKYSALLDENKEAIAEVRWCAGSFVANGSLGANHHALTIVGNIYEHPHLLDEEISKKKKQRQVTDVTLQSNIEYKSHD